MIVVQRVRVRWRADSRGSAAANQRRGIPDAYPLPTGEGDYLVHDVLVDQDNDYHPTHELGALPARVGVDITRSVDGLSVRRRTIGDSFPQRGAGRLFSLRDGQLGRYHTNFRFTGCQCDAHWWYEQWTLSVAHADLSPPADLLQRVADVTVDARVSLYGAHRRQRVSPPATGRDA